MAIEAKEPWYQILLEWLWELIKTVAVVFALVYLIRSFVIQPFIIQGASMEPNLHSGEYLLVERFSRLSHNFKRGDVIVFISAHGSGDDFIKRIIALPNETVTISDGQVFIRESNGTASFRLVETYLPPSTRTVAEGKAEQTLTLSPDEFYVLGDNRGASRDSRAFGSIKRAEIVGKAWLVTFPLEFFGHVRVPAYSQIISG